MRIGMLTNAYKPHVSGVTNYIALHKRYLEKAGHEVFVFTFGDEEYQDNEPNIIRSPGIPLIDTGFYISLNFNRRARHLLHTMDVAHVHHPVQIGTLALTYCKPRNIPIIFTNHTRYDLYAQAYLPILPEGTGETMMRAYLPLFCRACDRVIAPTPSIQQILLHLGVDAQIDVIPNGVELIPFQSSQLPIKRDELGIKQDETVLIYVGRLGPEKNLAFLLRAFRGTASAFNNLKLLIVGDGPERDNLQSQTQNMNMADKVIFTGMVPYEKIPGYMKIADAFVTASITETFGLSLVEAMAASLPVLGIKSPGISDIIEDGITGYLAEDDLASFTAKMVLLVNEEDTRQRMSERAYQAAENYDVARITQRLIELYERLYAQSSTKRQSLRYRMLHIFNQRK